MKKIFTSIMMLFLVAGAVFAQSDLQALRVIKYNKSESITVKQLKTRADVVQKQYGRALTIDEKKQLLKTMTEEKLLVQAATKAGISIPDSVVDQYFMSYLSQQVGANVTETEVDDMLKKTQGVSLNEYYVQNFGMSVAEYKQQLKFQLLAQQYVATTKQNEIAALAPTDEEIRMFYEGNKASFVWSDMAKVFMLIVPKAGNPEAAMTKANEYRNKFVDKKLTVDQLSVQSRAANSGFQSGEMLLPKTEAGAASIGMSYQNLIFLFSQKEGFISDLEETAEDFRFISLSKKYDAKMLAISDIVQPETTVTVYDYIRQNLGQQKQMMYVQQAAQEIADSLNKPEFVEEKKTGAALDKLLDWGN